MRKFTLKSILVVALLLCCVINISANVYTGSCGTNATYTLDTTTGLLEIKGSGKMASYYYGQTPWYSNRSYIKSVKIYDGITSVGECAFWSCTSLSSVTIPDGVTIIADYAFEGCYDLMSVTIPNSVKSIGIEAFALCFDMTSVTIPNSVTSIGNSTFERCSRLTSVTISNYVTNIGNSVFKGCSGLTSVTIPNSVTNIGNSTFQDCSGLTSVTMSDYVTNIGNSAFKGCSGLTSVVLPYSASIEDYAFEDCSALTSVRIGNYGCGISHRPLKPFLKNGMMNINNLMNAAPSIDDTLTIGKCAFQNCNKLNSVHMGSNISSIGADAFYGCNKLSEVIYYSLESLYSISFGNKSANPLYYAHKLGIFGRGEIKEIIIPRSITSISDYALSGYNGIIAAPLNLKTHILNAGISRYNLFVYDDFTQYLTSYIQGFKTKEPDLGSTLAFTNIEPYINITNTKFFLSDGTELSYTKSTDGYYTVKGLRVGKSNAIKVTYTDGESKEQSCEFNVDTKIPSCSISTSVTQSTVTVKSVTAESDITCTSSPKNWGVSHRGTDYSSLPAVIEGCYPGENMYVYPFAYYDGELVYFSSVKVQTLSLTAEVDRDVRTTASSIQVSGKYTNGDATITDEQFTINGKIYKGNDVVATGLNPDTKYTVTYSLKANGYEFKGTRDFTTRQLSMKTSAPKVISSGNVIVAAETNVSNEETNVGFEWRRTDWPDDFTSNTGTAYIYNGKIEGYIRNLNTEKLWRFRPYYLSDSGRYYYGDWMGLDPTNTSYFEATVHTYDNVKIEGNTALVKGYALRGTDAIKVQGFMYWKKAAGVKGESLPLNVTAIPSDVKTVEASGQVMTASLTDLEYSTTYSYLAFVTTTEGETFYGEEMSFTTGDSTTGINEIVVEDKTTTQVSVAGYYDLNGLRINGPQRGDIYIIRYTDGTCRKIIKR